MLVVGCDPATGASSPLGIVCFDPDTKGLHFFKECGSNLELTHHRIKDISDVVEDMLLDLDANNEKKPILFCIESFVMRGKGGETLQRLIGSVLGRVPYRFDTREVGNTRMKLIVGGHGKASKQEVAMGVLEWFRDNEDSTRRVQWLIKNRAWDVLDALGIGIAGYELEGGS